MSSLKKRFKSELGSDILSENVLMGRSAKQYQVVELSSRPENAADAVIGKGVSIYDALRDTYKRQGRAYTEQELKK